MGRWVVAAISFQVGKALPPNSHMRKIAMLVIGITQSIQFRNLHDQIFPVSKMWEKKGAIGGDCLRYFYSKFLFINPPSGINTFHSKNLAKLPFPILTQYSVISSYLNPTARKLKDTDLLAHSKFSAFYSTKAPSRSFRKRNNKRAKANSKPILDEARFQQAISQLPSRFINEELCKILTLEDDPLVCLELFNWASQQHRFRHDASTYHVTIKKLGIAKMYQEMDDVVNQLLAVPQIGNEALYNSIIYYFTEARKLTRAMVDDGIEPDIFSLNSMMKGYVLSLHINDALRVFHQMGVVYKCLPNSFSYDYLVHGLCAQGRTNNAIELFDEMKEKGFVLSNKSFNSLVNALALGGEVKEAVNYLWEMIDKHRSVDIITYKTVLDEICRQGRVGEATSLLKEWQEKDLVDGITYRELLHVLEDDFGNSNDRERFRY
ncbi:hypothetical protein OIU77_005910 [Salix suchowensis]|uniref:Pentatricopeptide repeat-containing protein n=1 Tax=Salix suchowensis TaxID=1278906 RepID=A0ABQ9AR33_9ROSI|nr:hypothetical protein OIU77_005910 [Salix suchowensis]